MNYINRICLAVAILVSFTTGGVLLQNDGSDDVSRDTKISGGVNARRNEFPHICTIELIRLILPDQTVGNGNIINSRWILTVASALEHSLFLAHYEIVCGRLLSGSNVNEPNQQRLRTTNIVRHDNYIGGLSSANDIALIRLASQLLFSPNVQPITLPPQSPGNMTGIATLIGWGGGILSSTWFGLYMSQLQMSRVPILTDQLCQIYIGNRVFPNGSTHMCTGNMDGGDTPCSMDLGSSLLQNLANETVIIGLVSLPQSCGVQLYEPGTYTKVSLYVNWIRMVAPNI